MPRGVPGYWTLMASDRRIPNGCWPKEKPQPLSLTNRSSVAHPLDSKLACKRARVPVHCKKRLGHSCARHRGNRRGRNRPTLDNRKRDENRKGQSLESHSVNCYLTPQFSCKHL